MSFTVRYYEAQQCTHPTEHNYMALQYTSFTELQGTEMYVSHSTQL